MKRLSTDFSVIIAAVSASSSGLIEVTHWCFKLLLVACLFRICIRMRHFCYVLFFSCPRSEGWSHHGRTISVHICPLSFWLTRPQGVLCISWCCPSRLCVVFLACMHLALYLALSCDLVSCRASLSECRPFFFFNFRFYLQSDPFHYGKHLEVIFYFGFCETCCCCQFDIGGSLA